MTIINASSRPVRTASPPTGVLVFSGLLRLTTGQALAAILGAVALVATPGPATAQDLEHHLDCAAAYLLWGSIYSDDQREAQRRMGLVYDVLRTDAGASDPDLAWAPDTFLNGVVFDMTRSLMEDLLSLGAEDGALASIIKAQNCDLDYGFDFF